MANSIAYDPPGSGATAPTANQMLTHQQASGIVTGDGSATSVTFTHNMNLPSPFGQYPEVEFEPLLAAFVTAAPIIASKTANTVVLTVVGFSGAAFRIRIKRPWSPTK